MTHLLVAVDGSEPGRAALRWAETFLQGADPPGTAEVLTIWIPQEVMGLDGFDIVDGSEYPLAAEMLVDELLAEIGRPVNFRGAVGSGRAADSILVAAHDSDLVVIGTRAAGPVRQALVGSMSQSIVGRTSCPVAVVPEAFPDPGGQTVVAWDGTAGAIAALQWALEHRAVDNIRVVFVAATDDHDGHALHVRDDIAEVFGAEVSELLVIDIRSGDPSDELGTAGSSASEIVIGERGCFGPDGSIWGSVTSHVLSNAQVPVIVVPTRDLGL